VPDVLLGPRDGRRLSAATQLASVGIEFSVSTVIGLLGGQWLDKKLGTAPFLMIVGLILGVIAGGRSLIAAARKANARSTKKDD
jgi:ATP synthase protein I